MRTQRVNEGSMRAMIKEHLSLHSYLEQLLF